MALIPIIGAIALPYVKPWTLRFGIPAICTVVATLLFLTSSCGRWEFTKEAPPGGSPITSVFRVYVAATFKMCKSYPRTAEGYHKEDQNESFKPTRFLRFLEKAAITSHEDDKQESRWTLCSVAEVEEAKIALRMVPMWIPFVICGIVSSVGNTYFIEQASKMNRAIGSWKVPLQILLFLQEKVMEYVLRRLAVCIIKKYPTYGAPTGIAFAMLFSILCCITAGLVETRRIENIKRHGLLDKPEDVIPMSVFWLLFQFFLLAGLNSFYRKSVDAFYNDQSPKIMRNYVEFFARGVSGLGYMCSVLSVYVVGKISERGGRQNWFQFTLNRSRLDRYYWVLAGLSSVNLVMFILVASQYTYMHTKVDDDEVGNEETGGGPGPLADFLKASTEL